jgi:hypothetical protein
MIFSEAEIIFKKIQQSLSNQSLLNLRRGSGKSFLRHSGTWEGDDFEKCLQAIYDKCPMTTKFADGGKVTIKQRNIEATRNSADAQS